MDYYGHVKVRLRVVISRDDKLERGRNVVIRSIYCERSEAEATLQAFRDLNPHLAKDIWATFETNPEPLM